MQRSASTHICVNTYMHYADSLRVANLCFSFQIYVLSYAVKGALSERKKQSEICKYVLGVILHALCDIDCIFLHKTLYIVSFALLSKIPKNWSTGVKVFQQRIPCSFCCIQKVVKFSHSIIDLTRARHFSLGIALFSIIPSHHHILLLVNPLCLLSWWAAKRFGLVDLILSSSAFL